MLVKRGRCYTGSKDGRVFHGSLSPIVTKFVSRKHLWCRRYTWLMIHSNSGVMRDDNLIMVLLHFIVQFNCCGVDGPQDYIHTAWFNHTQDRAGTFVPLSCCIPVRRKLHFAINENFCQVHAVLYPASLNESQYLSLRVSTSYSRIILMLFQCILMHGKTFLWYGIANIIRTLNGINYWYMPLHATGATSMMAPAISCNFMLHTARYQLYN